MTEPPELPHDPPRPTHGLPEPRLPAAPDPVPPENAGSEMAESESTAPASLPPEPAEPEPVAAPAEPPAPSQSPSSPPPRMAASSRSALAVFSAIGFLLMAGVLFYLWNQLQTLAQQVDPTQTVALQVELRSLQQRVAQLEQRPAPVIPAPPSLPAPVDLRPLEARIAALEQRPVAVPAAPAPAPTPAPSYDSAALNAQLAALQARVAQAEARAGQVGDAAALAARLQTAQVALAFGQKLGDIPGAPPALTRFATANPPTEASLRLEFATAARQAESVSRPDTASLSFGARMWQRLTSLVTVRRGNEVVVGAPAAVVLGAALDKLEAGDLAGAVAGLDGLDGPAAQAMAGWRAKAQSLLDARAALAAMARG